MICQSGAKFSSSSSSRKGQKAKKDIEDAVSAKSSDIEAIQADLNEVNDMFLDLGSLVQNQGELLSIESNIAQAVCDVDRASGEL